MIVVYFILFNSLIYFLGRGATIILEFATRKNNFFNSSFLGLPGTFFYQIFGLFLVGNITLIINFFIGVDNLFTYFFFIFVLFVNIFKIKKIKISLLAAVNYLLIPAILSISTIGMGLHIDASLYHLAYQNWLRTEKIVVGLSNLHGRFGFSSMYDYISSVFWIEGNYIILHFINLVFFSIFFNFLVYNLFENKKGYLFYSSIFIIGFGLLDNFGFSGGRNGFIYFEGVGKQDVAFAVLFFITTVLFIEALLKHNFSIQNLTVLTMLTLFTTQVRIMGASLLIFELVFIFYFVRKESFYKLFSVLSPFVLLTGLWLFKNLVISGCLFYPIEFSCFSGVSWYVDDQAAKESLATAKFFYGLSTEENIIAWYKHWFASDFNRTLSYNFGISFIILFLVRIVFFKAADIDYKILRFTLVFLAVNFYFWLNNAPGVRFIMGSILVTVSLLGIGNLNPRFRKTKKLINNFNLLLVILLICITLLPRTYKYSEFVNSPTKMYFISSSEVELIKNPIGWGYLPIFGDECGTDIDCIPYKKVVAESISRNLNYKIFK